MQVRDAHECHLSNPMRTLVLSSTMPSSSSVYVRLNLQHCTYIFVQLDDVRPSSQSLCDVSFKIIKSTLEHFCLLINRQKYTVFVSHFKPAFFDTDMSTTSHFTVTLDCHTHRVHFVAQQFASGHL